MSKRPRFPGGEVYLSAPTGGDALKGEHPFMVFAQEE